MGVWRGEHTACAWARNSRVRVADARDQVLRYLDEHALTVGFFLHSVSLAHEVEDLLEMRRIVQLPNDL